jgi:hypothetical protein
MKWAYIVQTLEEISAVCEQLLTFAEELERGKLFADGSSFRVCGSRLNNTEDQLMGK